LAGLGAVSRFRLVGLSGRRATAGVRRAGNRYRLARGRT
jgi:hypothetical protein